VRATSKTVGIDCTARQGQYLEFIYHYSRIHGMPPAEADFRRFFRVTPPVVYQRNPGRLGNTEGAGYLVGEKFLTYIRAAD
jgi:hypothetical protein